MKSALVNDIDRLIATQSETWPMLARGVAGLRMAQTRSERVAGRELFVRHIPHRITSTTAAVDPESVSRRACFLCPKNLPPEEKGIPFDAEFAMYCNPFPILDRHLTIVHADHRPQRIADSIDAMLRLAEALPDLFVIYNGPQCGASAPDHLHFQACSREIYPIERDTLGFPGPIVPHYARRVFLLRGAESTRLAAELLALIDILAQVSPNPVEPMLNIATLYGADGWTVFVFPRGKHRPRVYETGELTVSPATIDLCGVFVIPVLRDFERIKGDDIERIFEEVTLPSEEFADALRRWEARS
jgi:uncharacterized protein DUF4922